ncbi:MAG: HAD family hydrolase, partial [Flavobacterium nitrogenifigens]
MKKIKRIVGMKITGVFIFLFLITACKKGDAKLENAETKDTAQTAVSIEEPLASWNDTKVKKDIIAYVEQVTDENSKSFIPVEDRIATFDNDGTLWAEQPVYFQLFFALDQVKAQAAKHPEWKDKQPFKAVLENNMPELMKQGKLGLMQIIAVSHTGVTNEQFDANVKAWINSAKHPTKKKLYKDLVYQPMLELIKYLQENDFKVFIVSGGGIDFMRAWAEDVYGIPKDQIIGSNLKGEYQYKDGKAAIVKLPELDFNDDKEGKP